MGQQVEAGLIYPDDARSSLAAFFERWPALLPPAAYGRFVPLRRPLDRPLHTIAQAVQQAREMRRIIGDAKGAADHFTDPLARPDPAPKAIGLGSTVQQSRQLGTLLGSQLRRVPRGWMRPQSFLHPFHTSALQPLAHR